VIADVARGEFDHDELVRLIAGAITEADTQHGRPDHSDAVLRAHGIRGTTIRHLDIDVLAGEVVGVTGVLGSGREELASILFGAADGEVDDMRLENQPVAKRSPRRSIEMGMAYVPGDRHRHGAVMTMSARENMTLPRMNALRRLLGRLDTRAERSEVQSWMERVKLRPPDPERMLALFSGGNQQKVVLAKWLRNDPKVLLMDEPTQGVDVGAKAGIFELIAGAAAGGAGVLISSFDAKELALICDRVLVMRDGELVMEVDKADLSEARLVSAALARGRSSGSRIETDHASG
jgi:ribose transport system ATP-binding protein